MKNIVFIGNDSFANELLKSILDFKFIYVITKNDNKKGRYQKFCENKISETAKKYNIPIYKTNNINNSVTEKFITNLNIDIIIMTGFGQKIKANIFNIPKYGIINIHPSILPKFKGSTPIQSCILNGEKKTGISIIKINEHIDSGDIIHIETCNVQNDDNFISLSNKLINITKLCIKNVLLKIEKNEIIKYNINNLDESYTKKFENSFFKINWLDKAINIDRKIKAFYGIKKISVKIKNLEFKLIETEIIENYNNELPGKVIDINRNGIVISTGLHFLKITKIQFPSKKEKYIKEIFEFIKNIIQINDKIE